MDDPMMPNLFHAQNDANTDQCCVHWAVEICDQSTDTAQIHDKHMRS